MRTITSCPYCKGKLTVCYKQHVEYMVDSIDLPSGVIEDDDHPDVYGTELIHIGCSTCNRYWYSVRELQRETGVEPCDECSGTRYPKNEHDVHCSLHPDNLVKAKS